MISLPGQKQEFGSISVGWTTWSFLYLLNSPLHCHVIRRWQLAPGLLKSQAAHVASSTMAEGWMQ